MKLSGLRYNINEAFALRANAFRRPGHRVPATSLVPSCVMSRPLNQPKTLTALARAWNPPTVPLRHRQGCLARGGPGAMQLPEQFSADAPMSPTALRLSKIDIFFPILTQEAFSDFVR